MNLRCAIIDDDPDWVDLIAHSLGRSRVRFETVPFFDGLVALEYLRHARVDLIVCDLQMPRIDGLGFVAELRLVDKATPVVLISSDPSAASEALARGANAFVRKGALNSQLVATVEELVAVASRQALGPA